MLSLKEVVLVTLGFGSGLAAASLFTKYLVKEKPVEKEVVFSQEDIEIRVTVSPEMIAENQASGMATFAMKLAPKFTTAQIMEEVRFQLENRLLNEGVETYSRIKGNTVIIEVLNSKDLVAFEVKKGISKALLEKGIGYSIE